MTPEEERAMQAAILRIEKRLDSLLATKPVVIQWPERYLVDMTGEMEN